MVFLNLPGCCARIGYEQPTTGAPYVWHVPCDDRADMAAQIARSAFVVVAAVYSSACYDYSVVPMNAASAFASHEDVETVEGKTVNLADVSSVEPLPPEGKRFRAAGITILPAPSDDESPPDVKVDGPVNISTGHVLDVYGPKRRVSIPQYAVRGLRVRRYNEGKTAGAAIPIAVGVAVAVGALVTLIAFAAGPHCIGGPCGSFGSGFGD